MKVRSPWGLLEAPYKTPSPADPDWRPWWRNPDREIFVKAYRQEGWLSQKTGEIVTNVDEKGHGWLPAQCEKTVQGNSSSMDRYH